MKITPIPQAGVLAKYPNKSAPLPMTFAEKLQLEKIKFAHKANVVVKS